MPSETSSEPHLRDPDVKEGIRYWESQSANYDGVLGMSPVHLLHLPRMISIG